MSDKNIQEYEDELRTRKIHEFTSASAQTTERVVTAAWRLKSAGHAIVIDETFDAKLHRTQLRVTHYRSCRVCP